VKKWTLFGENSALPLHFGLFLDAERSSEAALESECIPGKSKT